MLVTLKVVPKAHENCSESRAMEEINNARQGKPEQTFDVAFGTIFRIKKCFQRSKQKVNIHFSL